MNCVIKGHGLCDVIRLFLGKGLKQILMKMGGL